MTLIRAAPCCLCMDVIKKKRKKTTLSVRRLNTSQSHLPPPSSPSYSSLLSSRIIRTKKRKKKSIFLKCKKPPPVHVQQLTVGVFLLCSGHSRQSRPLLHPRTSFLPSCFSSSSVVVDAQLLDSGGGGASAESWQLQPVAAMSSWQLRGRTVKELSSTSW